MHSREVHDETGRLWTLFLSSHLRETQRLVFLRERFSSQYAVPLLLFRQLHFSGEICLHGMAMQQDTGTRLDAYDGAHSRT